MIYSKEELSRDATGKLTPAAQRLMNDEKLDGLRSLKTRRILAVTVLLLALSHIVSYSLNGAASIFAVLNFIAFLASWMLLSRINRGFLDLADELVDERIRFRRNEMYKYSFFGIVGLMALVIPTMMITRAFTGSTIFGADPVAAMMALFWSVCVMPSVVFAWNEAEL